MCTGSPVSLGLCQLSLQLGSLLLQAIGFAGKRGRLSLCSLQALISLLIPPYIFQRLLSPHSQSSMLAKCLNATNTLALVHSAQRTSHKEKLDFAFDFIGNVEDIYLQITPP